MQDKSIDFGKIIKRSWNLTLKNKWLWVLGLILAIFAGGSFSGSNFYSNTSSNNTKNASFGNANYFLNLIKSVPVSSWIFLGIGFLVCIIFGFAISWVITSWAKGALIAGIEDVEEGKKVDLKILGKYGIANIKDLIVFRLISAGIFWLMILSLILITGIAIGLSLVFPDLKIFWIVIFSFIGILAFFVSIIMFAMIGIYAERLIVLKSYSSWKAWKKALSISRGNILPTFIMSVINSTIGCFVGCLSMIALLIVLGGIGFAVFSFMKNPFGIALVIILIILFFVITFLIKALLVVFNYGNWNQIFKIVFKEKTK